MMTVVKKQEEEEEERKIDGKGEEDRMEKNTMKQKREKRNREEEGSTTVRFLIRPPHITGSPLRRHAALRAVAVTRKRIRGGERSKREEEENVDEEVVERWEWQPRNG